MTRLIAARFDLYVAAGARVAGLAFPNHRGFVAPPRRQMPIETVVADVDFSTVEPFGVRRFPLQNSVPLLKPVQFALSESRPELFRIVARFSAHRFEFG